MKSNWKEDFSTRTEKNADILQETILRNEDNVHFFNEILELADHPNVSFYMWKENGVANILVEGLRQTPHLKNSFPLVGCIFKLFNGTSCLHLHHPQQAKTALTHLSSIGFVSSFPKNPISTYILCNNTFYHVFPHSFFQGHYKSRHSWFLKLVTFKTLCWNYFSYSMQMFKPFRIIFLYLLFHWSCHEVSFYVLIHNFILSIIPYNLVCTSESHEFSCFLVLCCQCSDPYNKAGLIVVSHYFVT